MSGNDGIYTEQFRADLRNAVRTARSDLGRTFKEKGFQANRAKAYYEIAGALLREADRIVERDGRSIFEADQAYTRLREAAQLLQAQAEITTGSGEEGAGAILGNLFAKAMGGTRYDVGLEEFSWEITDATLQFFEAIVGVGNVFAFNQITPNNQKAVDGTVWQARGLIDLFPGTALGIEYTQVGVNSLVWQTTYAQKGVKEALEERDFDQFDYLRAGGAQVASAWGTAEFQSLGNNPAYFGFNIDTLPTDPGASKRSPDGSKEFIVDEFGRARIQDINTGVWVWVEDGNGYIGFLDKIGAAVVSTIIPPNFMEPFVDIEWLQTPFPSDERILVKNWRVVDADGGLLVHGADQLRDYIGFGYGVGGTRVRHNQNSDFYDNSTSVLLRV